MAEQHRLMGGNLNIYKRENSRHWQCSTYLNGRNRRTSTRTEGLSDARACAEQWYFELRGRY